MPDTAPDPDVSVIVVSQGRDRLLRRCLTGISQLLYKPFEIVVVTNPDAIGVCADLPFASSVKWVSFEEQNISAARNKGIMAAGGDICAFIDDDAVPEPTWLQFLTEPFSDPEVSATGGFVVGRNGISFQWKASGVAPGQPDIALEVPEDYWSVPEPPAGYAVKTQGTNCAFRRSSLTEIGGFDERYHFFLDETDMNMALAAAGEKIAVAPLAHIHHSVARSVRRHADRTPKTLFDIGASSAVFFGKWLPSEQVLAAQADLQSQQCQRLVRLKITQPERERLMQTLVAGFAAGSEREKQPAPSFPKVDLLRFRRLGPVRGNRILAGRFWSKKRLRKKARTLALQGWTVSVFLFSPTALFHRVRYDDKGFWEQAGGLFGRSCRNEPLFRFKRFRSRLKEETTRVARVRGLKGGKTVEHI